MKKASFYLFCAIGLLPFIHLLLLSFASQWQPDKLIPQSLGLQNWQQIAQQGLLTNHLFRSLTLSTIVALLSTGIGYPLGRLLSQSPRKPLWLSLAYLPYAFSPVIYAYCLQYYFLSTGLSGSILGIIIAQALLFTPFSVLFFINFWSPRLIAMQHLALTLGSSPNQVWLKVWIPMSMPALRAIFAQIFLFSWFDYGLTIVIGSGRVTTLSLLVWQYISESNPYYAAIGSCVLMLPAALLLFLSGRLTTP